jgi:uncharacterized protein YrzB (UPF0473 family)
MGYRIFSKEAIEMNEEMNENADLFTLVDEDGVEQNFEFVDEYEEDGTVYYALVPYYDDPTEIIDADTELVVLKVEQDDNGEDILSTIDDDDEYERIGNIFMDRIQESYDSE